MSAPSLQRLRLREPGLPAVVPGRERYRIGGGCTLVVRLAAGDRLTLTNCEGRQLCEIAVLTAEGEDPGALGLRPGPRGGSLARVLRRDDTTGAQLRKVCTTLGCSPELEKVATLFDPDGPAGESLSMQAQRNCVAMMHATGSHMEPGEQTPPTELLLLIDRATIEEVPAPTLPEALAEPLQDFRVDRCTARAYEVKAGEYIQVIDVAGRQCSDFLAFQARRLESGVERGLDLTTTRTLTGTIYPAPGLYAKFFDQDMQPLVEVIRDTVGRHDSFGLACTAKFYEDLGYPGHANCSDNFNQVLEKYRIAPRRGWPAINFFYNTGIDSANAIFLDDPWSRPGDYVLMRALTDLVCASSACPDDVDATNAWNPTDVHVRVYRAAETFSKASVYRMAPDSEPRLTQETGFHARTSALTREFTEYRGYWLPVKYPGHGTMAEYHACREAAVVIDLSALRKFEILGPDAELLLQTACTRNIRRLADNQAVYTAICYPTGGMLDDGIVYRLGAERYRLVVGDEYTGTWVRELARERGLKVWVKSATDQLHNIAVQGPNSRRILSEIVWTPPAQPKLTELAWFSFLIGRIGGPDGTPVVISRTGYTGELGYEIFSHPKDAVVIWDAVMQAGGPHGLIPMGLAALDILRIEAGLVFAGYEFCDQTDPFEAGISFAVALKTNEEFIGRDALQRRKESPQRVLVGLELAGNEATGRGDCVHSGRAQVGVVTSGTRSPLLAKNIALARVDISCSTIGTQLEVGKLDGHQKRIPATVVRFPFYDPEKTRPRS